MTPGRSASSTGYVLHWNGAMWAVAKAFKESPPLAQGTHGRHRVQPD